MERKTTDMAINQLKGCLPYTAKFALLSFHLFCLRKRNSILIGRVWEEIGNIIGTSGSLTVNFSGRPVNLRLGVNTQPMGKTDADKLAIKAAQGGAYKVLTQALAAGAASKTESPSFSVVPPAIPANDVVLQVIRDRLSGLPTKCPHYGTLSYQECKVKFPFAARFLVRRLQERQLEAKLEHLRQKVMTELQAGAYTFDQNIRVAIYGTQLSVALFLQPVIKLQPQATDWETKLAQAKTNLVTLFGKLRDANQLIEVSYPQIVASSVIPSKLVNLPVTTDLNSAKVA